ncbi:hypothetical protein [Kaarinaea lacus]
MTNSIVNRISRIIFGSSLIIATMVVNTAPLGGFAILPLIAVPLILSGIYGENPLGELIATPFNNLKVRFSNYIAKLFKHDTAAV